METRDEMRVAGYNGVESALAISIGFGAILPDLHERHMRVPEEAKELFRLLNDAGLRYAIIGAVAVAHYAVPRATQDVDLLIAHADLKNVIELLSDFYRQGGPESLVFDYKGIRCDFLPANLLFKQDALRNAQMTEVESIPVRVASLRDLILMKLFASPNRPEISKAMLDQADIAGLIEHQKQAITREDIAYIAQQLLRLAYTPEEQQKYRGMVNWLNDVLERLGMADKQFKT
jgi:hypothetical protein